jgi:hypothetical protein
MGYDMPLEYYSEREREVPGPSYTSDEMSQWDDDDREAAKHAMDNHIYMEHQRLQEENARLRAHIESLGMSTPEHLERMSMMSADEHRIMRRNR